MTHALPTRRSADLRGHEQHGVAGGDLAEAGLEGIAAIAGHAAEPGCGAGGRLQLAIGGLAREDEGQFQRHIVVAVERSEEHTSELQSLMRISYAVFCLKKKRYYTLTASSQ